MTLLTLALPLNSNKLLFFLLITILAGCGVKSDPRPPAETMLPSIGSKYLISTKKKESDKEDELKLKKEGKKKKK